MNETHRPRAVSLAVPAMARVVEDGVFDAWGWCESDVLEWRRPAASQGGPLDKSAAIDGSNPAGLVFVMHADCQFLQFLPKELASLHAPGYGLEHEWALAPYGIDDATDGLFEHRTRPRDVFWLAAPNLHALVWGLHDWVHFHNHGPFEDPATTELQCDLVALSWLRLNREVIGVGDEDLERVARQLAALSGKRFAEARKAPPVGDFEALFLGAYPAGPLGG